MRNFAVCLACLAVLVSAAWPSDAGTADRFSSEYDQEPASTAREKWDALIAENFRRRPKILTDPAVDYWSYVEGLPNVFIYGDSISIAYTDSVRAELEGSANVIRLPANGADSGMIIAKMEAMNAAMRDPALRDPWDMTWDIIHFNAGLHDLKYVVDGKLNKQDGEQVNSIEEYAQNLREAVAYFLQIAPGAQLIFATTTPVPKGEPGRFEQDAIVYNRAAVAVMAELGVPINDLYEFTLSHFEEWIIAEGNVHFTETGSAQQGVEVARVIRQYLPPPRDDRPDPQ